MTAITAALRAGLDNVYSKFGVDGVIDIGLQSALDVGVKAVNCAQAPRSCLLDITCQDGSKLTNISNGLSDCRIGRCELVVISDKWGTYTYNDKVLVGLQQGTLSSDKLGLLAVANYRAAVAAGWEERNTDLVASAHIMAFLLGALEPGRGRGGG